MIPLRVGINGLGRIGRSVFRSLMSGRQDDITVVAVNDLAEPGLLAHLLRFDTKYGRWSQVVDATSDTLRIDGRMVYVSSQPDPRHIDWDALNVDIVVEATGVFASRPTAAVHLDGGASCVIVTAPMADPDATILYGTNHVDWDPIATPVTSAGSCTAHAVAPLVTTLATSFGWKHGHMSTVHPSNPDSRGADSNGTDWRLTRGSAAGVIPKKTSAVDVIGRVLPDLVGRFSGVAYRVPTQSPGVVDLIVETQHATDVESVLAAFRRASQELPPNVLAVCDQALVASDYVGDQHSATVDAQLVEVTDGTQVHVTAWYDNEAGYSQRLVDLLRHAADHHAGAWQHHRSSALVRGSDRVYVRGVTVDR